MLEAEADGAIMIGEALRWAPDGSSHENILSAMLVTKTGEPRQLSARIQREGEQVWLAEEEAEAGGALPIFAPFYEAWGREIPTGWDP